MCGIFGIMNCCKCGQHTRRSSASVLDSLVQGLRRLEYRGYDSAGVALDTKGDKQEHTIVRCPGKIAALEQQLESDNLLRSASADTPPPDPPGSLSGIAHTRWATHGTPSAENTHPQSSGPENEFLVVHNGIVTNSATLRAMLEKHGFVFTSSTDTEVIPKLAKYLYDRSDQSLSFTELVMTVMRQLEGAYALLFKSSHFPGELVACKRGSPLILGLKERALNSVSAGVKRKRVHTASAAQENSAADNGCEFTATDAADASAGQPGASTTYRESTSDIACEFIVSSDSSAVVEHTKRVVVLEDNDIVHIKGCKHAIYSLPREQQLAYADNSVSRIVQTLTMEVEQIMKGDYEHFMQKEIQEQPDSLRQTLRGRCRTPSSSHWTGDSSTDEPTIVLGGLRDHLNSIRRSRRLIIVACGTSFHASLAIRPVLEELTEIPVQAEVASDLLDRRIPVFRDDAMIFVSQSGETAETLNALHYGKECGALCIGVTNTVGSAISRATHCGVHINAGVEIGVASTKAYTSQLAVLVMIALYLSSDSISKRKRRLQVMNDLARLPDLVRRCLALESRMQQLAMELKDKQSLLMFGRGANLATCLEGALKVKEVSLMHSEGVNAGEMKHGPLALVDSSMPLIAVATKDQTYSRMQSSIQQLRAREGRVMALVSESDSEIQDALGNDESMIIRVPDAEDCIQPILNIIPLQLLSYHLTLLRGFNVDMPRNLAKSVTTE